MLASFIITFREAIEAALIIGITTAYLRRIHREDLFIYLFSGTLAGVLLSIGTGALFIFIYNGLEGRTAEIFEGVTSLIGAIFLTYIIIFFAGQAKNIKNELHSNVDASLSRWSNFGIAALAFFAVFREGIETVVFLGAGITREPYSTLVGFAAGIIAVFLLSAAMFRGIYNLNYSKFFRATSIILVIFASGLIAYGVHELNEARIIPPVIEHVWDINPLLNEDSKIGGFLKSSVGYNGNPSLTEVLAYITYWFVTGYYLLRSFRGFENRAF